MLIGVGGSGKQSLAKLAVYMAGLTPVSIVISKSYSLNDFKADLQVRRGWPAKITLLVPYFQKMYTQNGVVIDAVLKGLMSLLYK